MGLTVSLFCCLAFLVLVPNQSPNEEVICVVCKCSPEIYRDLARFLSLNWKWPKPEQCLIQIWMTVEGSLLTWLYYTRSFCNGTFVSTTQWASPITLYVCLVAAKQVPVDSGRVHRSTPSSRGYAFQHTVTGEQQGCQNHCCISFLTQTRAHYTRACQHSPAIVHFRSSHSIMHCVLINLVEKKHFYIEETLLTAGGYLKKRL